MSVLTEEDLVLIRQLLEHLPHRVIARKFDCTTKELRAALDPDIPVESKTDRIRRLYSEGKTRPECAKIVGCRPNLVRYALGNQNLEPVISAGKVYSNLTVIEPTTPTKTRIKRYVCLCKCGKTHIARHDLLVAGKTRSCGCAKSELKKLTIDNVNRKKTPALRCKVKGSRTTTDYNLVRECHRLYTVEKLTIRKALERTGLALSAYYCHRDAALKELE